MSIQNLQQVVGFGLQLSECIVGAMGATSSVGKISAMLPLMEDVPSLLGVDWAAVKAELSQLQPADLDALNAYIDANFSIPDAQKQGKVDAAVALVINLAKLGEQAVAMVKGPAVAQSATVAAPAAS